MHGFHFADDTDLLNLNKSPKHLNKFINIDLKILQNGLMLIKYLYISQKQKWFYLEQKGKNMDFNLKIKLNGKQLYETNSVKCLGIRIYNKLDWEDHINDIALKLINANKILYKMWNFVDADILKSIYHAVFELHICYACIIWGQNMCTINRIFILHKKALRLIHFKELSVHTVPLFFK